MVYPENKTPGTYKVKTSTVRNLLFSTGSHLSNSVERTLVYVLGGGWRTLEGADTTEMYVVKEVVERIGDTPVWDRLMTEEESKEIDAFIAAGKDEDLSEYHQ